MINLDFNIEHQRVDASCYECTAECRLRDMINSPDIICCNYAAYGCTKYNGPIKKIIPKGGARFGDAKLNNQIRKRILELGKFKVSDLYDLTCDKQRIINGITLLRKSGYNIVNTKKCSDSEFEIMQ